MSWLLALLGYVLFVALVVVHEFGHFIVARRNGVEVEEFGIGFPPAVWRKRVKSKKGNYDFTINLLPLGGFVRLKGEHDIDSEKGSFGVARLWTKVKIMLAGVVMNALTAFVMFTLLALIGLPSLIENQFTVKSDTKVVKQQVLVGFVQPDSPAAKAGIKEYDRLVKFGRGMNLCNVEADCNDVIQTAEQLPEVTKKYAGKTDTIYVEREGQELEFQVTFRSNEEVEAAKQAGESKGYLGVSPAEFTVQRSTWSAPIVAAGLMKQITVATFKGLGSAIGGLAQGDTKKASEQVSGIVGIGYILTKGSALGLQFILFIIAIISLTLAIMNVLPIPALDGGRLFVTLLFKGLKKPLKPHVEDWIHGSGFVVLMLLFVLITIVDVKRIF